MREWQQKNWVLQQKNKIPASPFLIPFTLQFKVAEAL